MFISDTKFRAGPASRLADWGGAEGLNTLRKRGLLLGTAPPPAQADEGGRPERRRWNTYSFGEVCTLRLAKLLANAGVDGEVVRDIANNSRTVTYFDFAQRISEGRMKPPPGEARLPVEYLAYALGDMAPGAPRMAIGDRQYIDRLLAGEEAVRATTYLVVSLDEVRMDVIRRIDALASAEA